MDNTFHVFIDGSVIGNPGPGGWAAALIRDDKSWEISGSSQWTTISEMELLAAVEALRLIPDGSLVHLYSDSELLIRGMLYHCRRWHSQGWRNSRGTRRTRSETCVKACRVNRMPFVSCGASVSTRPTTGHR